MRSGRSLLLLVLVAAGLGAYIYFVEMARDPLADAAVTREKVFTLEPGSITEVEITDAASAVTRATRTDMTWSLQAPVAADADTVQVSTITSSLETLERMKMIDENPASAAPFGLDPARIRVAFKTTGDATSKALLIGNKTPTGGDLYAKIEGEPAVFLIGSYLEDTFNKTAFDLRDKTVLAFNRDEVSSVTLAQGGTRTMLEKPAGEWRLSSPLAARADGGVVEALISQVFQARMTSLSAEDAGTNLREYGLDKPTATITLGMGSSKAELAIGTQEDDNHYYARDLARPLVFSVDKTLVDELLKRGDDFRVKDVFAYRSFTAMGLDVTFGGVTYTFAKTKPEGENSLEHWSQTSPATETALDEPKFDDFLMTMSNLRAESFVATAATGGESITITARFGSAEMAETETVTLRKSGTTVQAIRDGEPGAAVVSTTDFDRALGIFKEIVGTK